MEDSNRAKCGLCRGLVASEQEFCNNCGFPANGSEKKKHKYKLDRLNTREKLEDLESKMRKIGYLIFLLAISNGVFALMSEDSTEQIIYAAISGLYFVSGILAFSKPFIGILCGFVIYVILLILIAVADPASLLSGILIKILVISGFIFVLTRFKVMEQMREELNFERMDGKEV